MLSSRSFEYLTIGTGEEHDAAAWVTEPPRTRCTTGFAEVAKALASGRRAEIVDVLAQGERSVDDVAGRDRPERRQHLPSPSGHGSRRAAVHTAGTAPGSTTRWRATGSATLWAALRDVAAEHVAGLERLAAAYLGDRDGVEVIGRDELAARLERGEVLVLDVRPEAEYTAGHIPGARSVPIGELRRHLRALPKDATVVAYCRGPYCVYADDAVRELNRQGLPGSDDSRTGSRSGSEPACRWQPGTEALPMAEDLLVDPEALREQVRDKYRDVAVDPHRAFHFHTGRPLAARLGYDARRGRRAPRPRRRVLRRRRQPVLTASPAAGERVVDVGSGAGFDSFIAAGQVGAEGRVVGVDMTPEMLEKSRDTADALGVRPRRVPRGPRRGDPGRGRLGRRGDLQRRHQPVRRQAGGVRGDPPRAQARRVAAVRRHRQRPAGAARSAARHRPVDWLNRGGLPRAGWQKMLEDTGFVDVRIGDAVDTFGGATGEEKARAYEVYGYAFLARRP